MGGGCRVVNFRNRQLRWGDGKKRTGPRAVKEPTRTEGARSSKKGRERREARKKRRMVEFKRGAIRKIQVARCTKGKLWRYSVRVHAKITHAPRSQSREPISACSRRRWAAQTTIRSGWHKRIGSSNYTGAGYGMDRPSRSFN